MVTAGTNETFSATSGAGARVITLAGMPGSDINAQIAGA
jgi:hypothetical protein